METFLNKIKLMWSDKFLRKKLLFVFFILIIFRLLSMIPIPGVDTEQLKSFLEQDKFLGFLNIFSGGGLSNLSIIMLGVGPYITSSIIMQLLTIMIPSLKKMYHEEGEIGRRKFTQYSRWLTLPLSVIQGYGLLLFLGKQGIFGNLTYMDQFSNLLVIVAGAMLTMWIGELASEKGIGNGVSLIIFAGIVAPLPSNIYEMALGYNLSQLPSYFLFLIIGLIIIAGVVSVTEAERPIPITYAKRIIGAKMYGGGSTYLPLRVNQAGVIPIIFALSILFLPTLIGKFLSISTNSAILNISRVLTGFQEIAWLYAIFYFLLVFIFTYFYTAVTFDPEMLSTNLQKNSAFIPGVRPGPSTASYISKVLSRITLVGASFLGLIAVMPLIVQAISESFSNIAIGGTSVLIVVSVVLDLIKKIDAQVSMREY